MLAHTLGMVLHQSLALSLVLGGKGVGIGSERHLGVDDHAPALGEADDDIGTEVLAGLVLGVLLDEELLVLAQAAVLQDGLQHHLAPVALHLAVALESLGEVGGIRAYLGGLLLEVRHGLLLLLLEEFHRSLEGMLQFLLAHLVHGLALLYRPLEVGKLLLDGFQEFVHLKAVVLLEGTLLGGELLGSGFLLFGGHPLHLLLQTFYFLLPLPVALLAELGGVLSLALHLQLQVLGIGRQYLRLGDELSLLVPGTLRRHQLANEEADGKTQYQSYCYFHCCLYFLLSLHLGIRMPKITCLDSRSFTSFSPQANTPYPQAMSFPYEDVNNLEMA